MSRLQPQHLALGPAMSASRLGLNIRQGHSVIGRDLAQVNLGLLFAGPACNRQPIMPSSEA